MHSSTGEHGGDLNNDTVTIIGATLDLQEKVVRQASAVHLDHSCGSLLLTTVPTGYDTDQGCFYALN